MTVRERHGLDILERNAKAVTVSRHRVGFRPGIEHDVMGFVARSHGEHQGETVVRAAFGFPRHLSHAGLPQRGILVDHAGSNRGEGIGDVVHEDEGLERIDRAKRRRYTSAHCSGSWGSFRTSIIDQIPLQGELPMRKIIVGAQVSMDGVMQAPGARSEDPTKGFSFGGWAMPYFDQVFGEEIDRVFKEKFDLLLGRRTYEIFAAYWPYYDDASHGGIAKLFN
ncbi:MAG TPA: hypothetical protein VFP44_12960, partial [Usitatibacter sp.]|nr:hypothetical protein [Usitatibacter sp.]